MQTHAQTAGHARGRFTETSGHRVSTVHERRSAPATTLPPTGERRKAAVALHAPDPGPAPDLARFSPADRERFQRLFLRGTNLQPPGTRVESCLAGSKQSIMVDLLGRPDGATMSELITALAGGRKSWTEATVRSGFGWDMKNKGYGVRSEFDATGVERFHLIVPAGQMIPPHSPVRKSKKTKK